MNPADATPAFVYSDSYTNSFRPESNTCQGWSVTPSLSNPIETSAIASRSVHKRLILLADSPNLFRSSQDCFGPEYCPDYAELLLIAKSRGKVVTAFAFVNDGFPLRRARALERIGYKTLRSEGRDCDFRFVDQAVAMYRQGDTFLLCSGDHRFAHLASALRDLGKYIIVCALRSCCSRRLIATANEFFPLPVMQRG